MGAICILAATRQANGQGGDIGSQYRTGLYYTDDAQRATAIASRAKEQARLGRTVMTEVMPAQQWYDAEKYHQSYLAKGGRFGRAQSAEKGCNDPIRCVSARTMARALSRPVCAC